MRLRHFGDSYDIVKKSLLQWLKPFGPWAAHPMLTEPFSDDDARAFSRFLGVPLVSTTVLSPSTNRASYLNLSGDFRSLFLDPDTGVRVEDCEARRRPRYLFAWELVTLANARPNGLLLCFDQSMRRGAEESELRAKLRHLAENGVRAFTYTSHASFIVAGSSPGLVDDAMKTMLAESGLPPDRLVSLATKASAC